MARMDDLQPEHRQLIEQDLAVREFVPTIERILKVSSFSTPAPGICKPIAA